MATWQEGHGYPGQQGPPPPGFIPPQPGYPTQGGFIPPQPGYPTQGGFPQGGGYPGGPPPTGGFGYSGDPTAYNQAGVYGGGAAGMQPGYNNFGDESMSGGNKFDFSDKSIRNGFIRKVYGILFVQLTITFAFVALFTFHNGTKLYVRQNPALWWVSLVVMLVCLITMTCCGDVRRKAPMNFIFLGLFTLAESFLLGCAVATFRAEEVMLAVGICTVVTLGLTLFAFQTKIDFTMMGGVLFAATLILLIFGIILMFWNGKIATLIYASFGALIFSVYIIYDTQIMLGGNHKHSISPEEYIFAALSLYLDIVNLFMYILTIIATASRD